MEDLYQRASQLSDATAALFASRGINDENAKTSATMAFAKNEYVSETFIRDIEEHGFFDKGKIGAAVLVGLPFMIYDFVRKEVKDIIRSIDDLSNITPNTKKTVTGKNELLLALGFPNATMVHGGDVLVPNTLLGCVEVKSIKNDWSYCHLTGGLDYPNRVQRLKEHLEDRGYDNLKSLNYALIRKILAEDNDPARMLGEISEILTAGDLPRLGIHLADTSARECDIPTNTEILETYFIPLAQHAFREMKVSRKFDIMMLVNRESGKTVFIESTRDLWSLYRLGFLKFLPSGLSFRGDYSTGIGISLGEYAQ